MNEVFRRRLIGLAVLLVLAFVLSLLLPKDDASTATGDAAATTVSLADSVPLPSPDTAPVPPPSRAEPASQGAASISAAPAAISDLHEEAAAARKPAPAAEAATAAAPSATKHPMAALKLSPTVSAPAAKPEPEKKPKAVAAAPTPTKPVVATPKPDPAWSPPKPRLAESVAGTPPAAPAPAKAAATSAAAAGWYVQIGSFSDAGKAETILSLLRKIGYKGEISKTVSASSGATLYRVRLGIFANEAAAKQAQDRVARQGYPQARVVSETGAAK
ncbi:MAG: hypothetical protein NVS9B10_14230 [Nevskia sp.]